MKVRDQLQTALGPTYRITGELRPGGTASVFVADDLRLGRKIVIKVLSPDLAATISADRFEREILVAASLQQANIVPVLAAGHAGTLPYFTMPFVEGLSLRDRLETGVAVPISETLRILGDIARALQYAHERGIVHRDIKPDNVLLSGGTAVVTDFGIAKALSESRKPTDSLTAFGTWVGTPAYMAPEQAAGDPLVDHRADYYALGCMAFELLTGHPPFRDRPPQALLLAHMTEPAARVETRRPDTPRALADFVARCLEKDPNRRPQTAGELVGALDSAARPHSDGASRPLSRRRRALFAYCIASAVVVVATRALMTVVGVPNWVLPGIIVLSLVGIPPVWFSWRRARLIGGAAAGVFVLLVTVATWTRAHGVGPLASLLGEKQLRERDQLVVTDFTVHGPDSSLGDVIAEGVRANLSQSSSVTVLSTARVAAALQRMRLPTTPVSLASARQIALAEGAKVVVTGDLHQVGQTFILTGRILSADSGAELAIRQVTVRDPAQLVAGIDKLSLQLRERIGESLKDLRASPPLDRVTTASIEALRYYTRGARANDVARDFPAAIRLLRQAVAIDPQFAMAWRRLSTALENANRPRSEIDFAIGQGYANRSRMTEPERLFLEAFYFFSRGRDRGYAAAAFERLLQSGDSLSSALNAYGHLEWQRRNYAHSESLFLATRRLSPENNVPFRFLVDLHFARGDTMGALELLAEGQRRTPNSTQLLTHERQELYHRGQYDEYLRFADSMRRVAATPRTRAFYSAALFRIHSLRGRVGEATRMLEESERIDSARGFPGPALNTAIIRARMQVWYLGRNARAVLLLDSALRATPLRTIPPADRPYSDVAEVYALAGRPDRARDVLAARDRELTDTAELRMQRDAEPRALAEIALAEHRFKDAVTLMRRSYRRIDGPIGNPAQEEFDLGRGFDAASETDSAIVHYQRYLTVGVFTRLTVDCLRLGSAYERLGRLYDARGDSANAVVYYEKFVALWANADAELQPQVRAIQHRIRALRTPG